MLSGIHNEPGTAAPHRREQPPSQPILEKTTLKRFLSMNADELRSILDELTTIRNKRELGLDDVVLASLIRVMDRAGYQKVFALGPAAAKAWAARVGVR